MTDHSPLDIESHIKRESESLVQNHLADAIAEAINNGIGVKRFIEMSHETWIEVLQNISRMADMDFTNAGRAMR